MKIVNNYGKPILLDDGTILAAAGTDGSEKTVKGLSDRDRRRLIDKGFIAIIEEPKPAKGKKEDN